jgi:hypothetical protein
VAKHQPTDVTAADDFLTRAKTLVGGPPSWKLSARATEYEAIWIIADDLGVEAGQLRFKWPRNSRASPAVSVIYRGNPIWRVDLAPEDECKFNPHDAHSYGLPPRLCGPHEHAWPDNRDYVIENGFGRMPYRRPVMPQLRRFIQILPSLADQINLTVTPEQRTFDSPPQGELLTVAKA